MKEQIKISLKDNIESTPEIEAWLAEVTKQINKMYYENILNLYQSGFTHIGVDASGNLTMKNIVDLRNILLTKNDDPPIIVDYVEMEKAIMAGLYDKLMPGIKPKAEKNKPFRIEQSKYTRKKWSR